MDGRDSPSEELLGGSAAQMGTACQASVSCELGDRGHRRPSSEVAWASGAQWTLTLANTAGLDLHAVHQRVPGDTVAPPGPVHLLKESRGGHRAPQQGGPHLTLLPRAWDISARAGNPWLEAMSAGPGPVPQRWAGTVPPNADRDGCMSLTPSHAARIPRGLSQGLGSYLLHPKAPPTPHAQPQSACSGVPARRPSPHQTASLTGFLPRTLQQTQCHCGPEEGDQGAWMARQGTPLLPRSGPGC